MIFVKETWCIYLYAIVTITHVYWLGGAPLARDTEQRHAALSLPLQYSGYRCTLYVKKYPTTEHFISLVILAIFYTNIFNM